MARLTKLSFLCAHPWCSEISAKTFISQLLSAFFLTTLTVFPFYSRPSRCVLSTSLRPAPFWLPLLGVLLRLPAKRSSTNTIPSLELRLGSIARQVQDQPDETLSIFSRTRHHGKDSSCWMWFLFLTATVICQVSLHPSTHCYAKWQWERSDILVSNRW